jgi:hypothetical protein
MMKIFAAGTVPAAVIIIGSARPYFGCAVDDRAISGEIGLRGQDVHHLRAGDARHELHGKGGDIGLGQRLDLSLAAIGVHDADDERARRQAGDLALGRAAYLQHDVGAGQRLGGAASKLAACRLVLAIRNPGGKARPFLHCDIGSEANELADGFRRHGDAGLRPLRFGWDSDAHGGQAFRA